MCHSEINVLLWLPTSRMSRRKSASERAKFCDFFGGDKGGGLSFRKTFTQPHIHPLVYTILAFRHSPCIHTVEPGNNASYLWNNIACRRRHRRYVCAYTLYPPTPKTKHTARPRGSTMDVMCPKNLVPGTSLGAFIMLLMGTIVNRTKYC